VTLDDLRASTKVALTVTDVARLLGLDERTVRRACEDGQLPCLRIGARRLIPREPLLALLSAPNVRGASPATAFTTDVHGDDHADTCTPQRHGVTRIGTR
jgi:excisionase family DNA binding protein